MYSFVNDYSEGAHERIIEALTATNRVQTCGYGLDEYCNEARAILAALLQRDSDIHFLVGGTQTNFTVISAVLRPHQGVLSAATGHINVHESGAVEATGHKVIILPSEDGKLRAADVRAAVSAHYADDSAEHMVQPGMVYISHPTEYGTLYTKEELKALRKVCEEYQLPLFLDGARLGYGLCAPGTDVTLADLAELCDVFYIGGTKVGALFGEAVVFPKKNTVPGFFTLMKQQGAVLAKGRLLGIQFDTLFTENLYLKISAHAIEMAMRIKELLTEHGCPLYINSPTNQQFVVLNAAQREALKDRVSCETWEELENGAAAVRFASSWATKSEDVEELGRILKTLP